MLFSRQCGMCSEFEKLVVEHVREFFHDDVISTEVFDPFKFVPMVTTGVGSGVSALNASP